MNISILIGGNKEIMNIWWVDLNNKNKNKIEKKRTKSTHHRVWKKKGKKKL